MTKESMIPETVKDRYTFDELPETVRSIIIEVQELKSRLAEIQNRPKAPRPDPKYYTTKEIMKRLQCSRTAIWDWRRRGLLKGTRVGNMVRFSETEIQEFLELKQNNKET